MGVVLTSVRRAARRLAALAIVLYVGAGTLATASACMPGPHRHHGVLAPDCVMHHQTESHHDMAAPGHHGSHGAHAHHPTTTEPRQPAMECACGDDLRAMHPADSVVLAAADPSAPTVTLAVAGPGQEQHPPSVDPRSVSPPPRA